MGENKKVMKKVLSMILAVLTVSVLLAAAVSAAYYKTIPGNLVKGGEFNSADVADYFWMNPDEGPYRGGTCVWQKDGGVGNSGCIRMNYTTDVNADPGLCSRNQKNEPMFPQALMPPSSGMPRTDADSDIRLQLRMASGRDL